TCVVSGRGKAKGNLPRGRATDAGGWCRVCSRGDLVGGLGAAKRIIERCRAEGVLKYRSEYDNCPATPNTIVRRVAVLDRVEGLEKARILLLGDDDLLSLALIAHGVVRRVTVADIDRELLTFIHTRGHGSVKLLRHDL